jgi:hypothetical protein
MRNLTDLLKRFTSSLNKDEIARQAVVDAVSASTGIKLAPQGISLKEGVLTISAGAAAKNEMRLKEARIIDTLKGLYNIRVSRVIYI